MAEVTVMVPLGDREVEMRKPTDGALVVLAKTFRGLPKIENFTPDDITDEMRARLVRNLGTLGKIVEGMVVKQADQDWLEDAMIDGTVSAEEVFGSIRVAGEKINGTAAAAKPVKTVRRRAAR